MDEARLVACALSRLLAEGTSKYRPVTYQLAKGLVDVCRQDVVHFGEVLSAPYPDLPLHGWPSGATALRHLAITGQDISDTWRRIRKQADDACLPVAWLVEFFPPMVWPALAAFISWGPAIARVRMEEAVATMATQTTTYDRRRRKAGSPIARNTIEPRISAIWKLMDVLIELRTQLAATQHPTLTPDLIDAWTFKPPRISARECGALDADQDNAGPAIDDCSTWLKKLAREVENTPKKGLYMRLRRLVLLALLCLFGTRADALRTTRVEDFLVGHSWPDGTRGPALRVFPGKSWHHAQAHYLPLPDQVATWLHKWIKINGFEIGQPDVPLFPTTKPEPGEPVRSLAQPSFYQAIAGQQRGPKRGSLPIMPKDGNRYEGWHPHAYRHTSYQLACRAAAEYKLANPTRLAHVAPEEFAAALAGHKLETSVSATYRSLNRQELSRAVVPVMWDILWGEGAQRLGVDLAAAKRAREARDFYAIMLRALEDDTRALQHEANQLAARAGGGSAASPTLLYAALVAGQRVMTKRDERDECRAKLRAAEDALAHALETRVPLDHDLTAAEYDALLADALGTADLGTVTPNDGVELAASITVADAAELWDTTEQTIRRWIRNGAPANRPAPWFDHAWDERTKKDRRLRVDAINHATLSAAQLERLQLIRVRRAAHDHACFHPALAITSNHDRHSKEHTLNDHQTTGRQTVDGLIDPWETSGSSPPESEPAIDDAGSHS